MEKQKEKQIENTFEIDETGWEKAFKKAAEEAGMSVEDYENKLYEEEKILNAFAKKFGI